MKKLLLCSVLLFIGANCYSQAQVCPISAAKISADSNCLFVTWMPELDTFPKPMSIEFSGVQFSRNDTIAGTTRYSLDANDSLANCDTVGWLDFVGTINVLFNGESICEFKEGEQFPDCPNNVLVSESENCLVFTLQEGYKGAPFPDSVRLKDNTYFNQGINPQSLGEMVFLKDTNMMCDSSDMDPLADTLFVGQKECVYADGILPITILAFEYQNRNDNIELFWEVNSEEPTRQLRLQKSYNGVKWMDVYEQSLENHTTGQTMTGRFTDGQVEQPKVYYRLFVSGYRGDSQYSNILPVTMKDQVINNLFYQSQSRSIMIKAGKNFTGNMHLINTRGQNVMSQEVQIQKNSYHEVLLRGHLTPGVYFVTFDNGLIPPTKIFVN